MTQVNILIYILYAMPANTEIRPGSQMPLNPTPCGKLHTFKFRCIKLNTILTSELITHR